MWIATDKDGTITLFHRKPELGFSDCYIICTTNWYSAINITREIAERILIDQPIPTFEDGPVEVK